MEVLLILAVICLVPRSSPIGDGQGPAPTVDSGSGSYTYSVVLDAGSTGSRVHVYKFQGSGAELALLSDEFVQLKPGLSSFADSPSKAAQSLKPLMDRAVEVVPAVQQPSTSVVLRATAGLRLLPGGQADAILQEVLAFLKTYKFMVDKNSVSILDGKDEGAYAWLTLNYLLGKLGGDPESTVASIDLGGGSVQEAFALTPAQAKAAKPGYVTSLRGAGKVYNVYVHSYLGYGLMASRSKVLAVAAASEPHPCFAKGQEVSYKYVETTYAITAARMTAAGTFDTCARVAVQAMNFTASCGAVQLECSFSGGWRGKGPGSSRSYYVSSYFWDRAQDAGIITDPAAIDWPTSPKEFGRKAADVCGLASSAVGKKYPGVKEEHAAFLCLDLAYCHSLLTQGFRLQEDSKITLVKQVRYNGQAVEAAWPLGAAINAL